MSLNVDHEPAAHAVPDARRPDVSIIVVSYGTRDMTIACLESVVRETHAVSYEVLVIDNASPDGSAEAIAAAFPSFRHLPQTQKFGFAAANNFAAKFARERWLKGEFERQ